MKMRRGMTAAVLALALVAGLFAAEAAAQRGKAQGEKPRLVIETRTADLGEVLEGQDCFYTFKIKNTGAGEAQILSVRPG